MSVLPKLPQLHNGSPHLAESTRAPGHCGTAEALDDPGADEVGLRRPYV